MQYLFNHVFKYNRNILIAFLLSLFLHAIVCFGYSIFTHNTEDDKEQLVVKIINTRLSKNSNYLDRILKSTKKTKNKTTIATQCKLF